MLRRALLAGLLILGGCGAPAQSSFEVHLVPRDDEDRPFAFAPATLIVPRGATVRWVNDREVFHTITFSDSPDVRVANGTFEQSVFRAGDTAAFALSAPGTYFYFCQPHAAFMFGSVTVR